MNTRKLHNARRAFWHRITAGTDWEENGTTLTPVTLRALVDSAFLAGARVGRDLGEKSARLALADAAEALEANALAEVVPSSFEHNPLSATIWDRIVAQFHRDLKNGKAA